MTLIVMLVLVKQYDADGSDDIRHYGVDNKVVSNNKSVSIDIGSLNQWYERSHNNNNLHEVDDNHSNNGKDKVRISDFNSFDGRNDTNLNSNHSPGDDNDNFKNISSISNRIVYTGTGNNNNYQDINNNYQGNNNHSSSSTTPLTTEHPRLQKQQQQQLSSQQGLLSTLKYQGGIITSSTTSSSSPHKAYSSIVGTPHLQGISSEPFVLVSMRFNSACGNQQ